MSESLENKYVYSTKKIGRGAFSKVYKGFNIKTDTIVAIKIIEKDILKETLLKRLYSEIKLMYTFDHENIVKIYDHYENKNSIFIILEYCAGGDLNELLKSTKLTENKAKDYSRQLVNGLKYLRSKNIIHRDLKPHNILLSSDKSILKLADFNFARKLWDGDLAQTLCGSPLYMAPEIISRNDYTISADLWSVGMIIYEMVYGTTPYNDAINPMDLLKKIKTRKIVFKDSISKNCNEMLYNLLQINPRKRMSWDALFNSEWLTEKQELMFSMSDSIETISETISENSENSKESTETSETTEISETSKISEISDISSVSEIKENKEVSETPINEVPIIPKTETLTNKISVFSQLENSNPKLVLQSRIDTPDNIPLKSIIIDDYRTGIVVNTTLASTPKAIKLVQPEDFKHDTPINSPRSLPSEFTHNLLEYMSSSVGNLSGAIRGAVNYLSQ